jgi:hypothetical protein
MELLSLQYQSLHNTQTFNSSRATDICALIIHKCIWDLQYGDFATPVHSTMQQ